MNRKVPWLSLEVPSQGAIMLVSSCNCWVDPPLESSRNLLQSCSVDLQNSSTEHTTTTTMAQDHTQMGCSQEVNAKMHSHNRQRNTSPQKACNKNAHCHMVTATFNQNDNRLIYPITVHGTKLMIAPRSLPISSLVLGVQSHPWP